MGAQEWALALLGIGILSEQFGGGRGLQELGAGVQSLVSAPLTGTGTGLTSLAGGLRSLAESFGDIGRGISDIFAAIPKTGPQGGLGGTLPTGIPGPPVIEGPFPAPAPSGPPLISMSGGDRSTAKPGGGGNVPKPVLPAPPLGGTGPSTPQGPFLLSGGSTKMVYNLV